jgi:hypothetical protein
MHTVLGPRGYTLLKSEWEGPPPELTVRPRTPGTPKHVRSPSFPAFRETSTKWYVPRHWGEARWGPADHVTLPPATPISVPFEGTLRPYQQAAVAHYLTHVGLSSDAPATPTSRGGGGLFSFPCGFGKCLAPGTLVLRADGLPVPVDSLQVGDGLCGDDGTPRTVLSLASGRERMYRIHRDDGTYFDCNESHQLVLRIGARDLVCSVREWLQASSALKQKTRAFRAPVSFPPTPVALDPWIVGALVGQGTWTRGYGSGSFAWPTSPTHAWTWTPQSRSVVRIGGPAWDAWRRDADDEQTWLTRSLRYNAPDVHRACLTGVLETAGTWMEFGQGILVLLASPAWQADVAWIARALGLGVELRGLWGVWVWGEALHTFPWTGPMGAFPRVPATRSCAESPLRVTPLGEGRYVGFELDGNRRFLLGDFTVTHNTSTALYTMTAVGLKTAVLVHKEFLMNQWIERMGQFVPAARIGRVQGDHVDVVDKDVIMVMVHSVAQRTYPASVWAGIGLLVVDEVHHLSSQMFSGALFQLVPRFTLGLSATLERKDGTSQVFRWFLGPVVHEETRVGGPVVEVRWTPFLSTDPAFLTVPRTRDGKVQSATLINQLCAFAPRTDFLVQAILSVCTDPRRQVLVLGWTRLLLEELERALRPTVTVGFYVGGMKPGDMKASETCQVLLATWHIAAEGVDIPSLNTLVMATPMTSVEQAVGRILRGQSTCVPVVIDVVDPHESLQNQAKKRKTFYRKTQCAIRGWDGTSHDPGSCAHADPKSDGEEDEPPRKRGCCLVSSRSS